MSILPLCSFIKRYVHSKDRIKHWKTRCAPCAAITCQKYFSGKSACIPGRNMTFANKLRPNLFQSSRATQLKKRCCQDRQPQRAGHFPIFFWGKKRGFTTFLQKFWSDNGISIVPSCHLGMSIFKYQWRNQRKTNGNPVSFLGKTPNLHPILVFM